MGWIGLLLGFVKDIIAKIFIEANKTPAEETHVHKVEGTARPVSDDVLAAAYGLHDRDQEGDASGDA